jgi:kynurenine 3-monooxygenase
MEKHIAISGAGPVGCLLSIYLARRGYQVTVVERRSDLRITNDDERRSINLALSNRGIRALRESGLDSFWLNICVPMNGRMIHNVAGETSFLPYGKAGQYINSIPRDALNTVLIDAAEAAGVHFRFQSRVAKVNDQPLALVLDSGETIPCDVAIGADGANSAVRKSLEARKVIACAEEMIEHGYKELTIQPGPGGFLLEKNALHIWPRESFMLIALPNQDFSFTCTLFLALNGAVSFTALDNPAGARNFFDTTFPDASQLLPDLEHQWKQNPVSMLGTLRCKPWSSNRILLIGDAAHAVVPFYGQGMNAGFEDCRVLNELLDRNNDDWDRVIPDFDSHRKPDADAIAQLALNNFIEMRDLVADPEFLLQKKIEARLHELFPEKWIPLYSMVTFEDNLRYSDAQRIGENQQQIMRDVMNIPGIEENWQMLDFDSIVSKLKK